MTQVLRVSKAGFNALTETNKKNYIFDIAVNHLKTAGSGTFTKAVSASSIARETVAHSLSVIPLVIAYFRENGGSNYFIAMSQPTSSTFARPLGDLNVALSVDSTNVYFDCSNNSGSSKTFEVSYEFLYEGV